MREFVNTLIYKDFIFNKLPPYQFFFAFSLPNQVTSHRVIHKVINNETTSKFHNFLSTRQIIILCFAQNTIDF